MDKVRNGTSPDGRSLCQSCRQGTVMKSGYDNKEQIYCAQIGNFIKIKVTECNRYDDRSVPSIYDMKDAAFILYTKNSKQIGFMRGAEFRKKFKGELDDLPEELPRPR